jgi:type II secretory pathway pseudopilin PulG
VVKQRGAGFLALLLAVALMSAAAAVGVQLTSTTLQREKEAQLLWAGAQIGRALQAYAQTAPDETQRHPRALEELLLDARGNAPRRFLRRLYEDPMSADGQWVLLRDAAGRIVAVHSRSTRAPLKRARFAPELARFEGATRYDQWVFGTPPVKVEATPAGAAR